MQRGIVSILNEIRDQGSLRIAVLDGLKNTETALKQKDQEKDRSEPFLETLPLTTMEDFKTCNDDLNKQWIKKWLRMFIIYCNS